MHIFKVKVDDEELNKHVKINLTIVFGSSKIEISWKWPKKGDFRKFLDPFQSPEFVKPRICEGFRDQKSQNAGNPCTLH